MEHSVRLTSPSHASIFRVNTPASSSERPRSTTECWCSKARERCWNRPECEGASEHHQTAGPCARCFLSALDSVPGCVLGMARPKNNAKRAMTARTASALRRPSMRARRCRRRWPEAGRSVPHIQECRLEVGVGDEGTPSPAPPALRRELLRHGRIRLDTSEEGGSQDRDDTAPASAVPIDHRGS